MFRRRQRRFQSSLTNSLTTQTNSLTSSISSRTRAMDNDIIVETKDNTLIEGEMEQGVKVEKYVKIEQGTKIEEDAKIEEDVQIESVLIENNLENNQFPVSRKRRLESNGKKFQAKAKRRKNICLTVGLHLDKSSNIDPSNYNPDGQLVDMVVNEVIPPERLVKLLANGKQYCYDILTLKLIVETQSVPKDPFSTLKFTPSILQFIKNHPAQYTEEIMETKKLAKEYERKQAVEEERAERERLRIEFGLDEEDEEDIDLLDEDDDDGDDYENMIEEAEDALLNRNQRNLQLNQNSQPNQNQRNSQPNQSQQNSQQNQNEVEYQNQNQNRNQRANRNRHDIQNANRNQQNLQVSQNQRENQENASEHAYHINNPPRRSFNEMDRFDEVEEVDSDAKTQVEEVVENNNRHHRPNNDQAQFNRFRQVMQPLFFQILRAEQVEYERRLLEDQLLMIALEQSRAESNE